MNFDYLGFISKYKDKLLAVTGPDSGQCTALAHALQRELGLPIVYGDAKDTLANAALFPDVYDVVKYKPGLVPSTRFAIMVFTGAVGNGAGHTGLYDHLLGPGFVSFDQNDPTGTFPHMQLHTWNNVAGWYIPKKLLIEGDLTMTPQVAAALDDIKRSVNDRAGEAAGRDAAISERLDEIELLLFGAKNDKSISIADRVEDVKRQVKDRSADVLAAIKK